jgi:hypothetical protein
MIFGKEIGEGLVGEVLYASAAILGEHVERKPDFWCKLDQLAPDIAWMRAKKHCSIFVDSRHRKHIRFAPVSSMPLVGSEALCQRPGAFGTKTRSARGREL